MKTSMYTTVLRAKQGEIEALSHLSYRAKSLMYPLIDVPLPGHSKNQSLSIYLGEKVGAVAHAWGVDRPLMIDLSRFAPNSLTESGVHPVTFVFELARQLNLNAIPVTGTELARGPGPKYLDAVSAIIKMQQRGAAIRFHYEEFANAEKLKRLIKDTILHLEITPKDCDILLDLEALDRLPNLTGQDEVESAFSLALTVTREFEFRNVILCGSSIPEAVGPEFNSLPARSRRMEYAAWSRLSSEKLNWGIGFGDYGVIYPMMQDGGSLGRPPARIRLSTDTEHVFYRAPRSDYRQLSKRVVGETCFSQQADSWGKKSIAGYGAGYTGVGNPSNWVARDMNAHIETTVLDISSKKVRSGVDVALERDSFGASHSPQSELDY